MNTNTTTAPVPVRGELARPATAREWACLATDALRSLNTATAHPGPTAGGWIRPRDLDASLAELEDLARALALTFTHATAWLESAYAQDQIRDDRLGEATAASIILAGYALEDATDTAQCLAAALDRVRYQTRHFGDVGANVTLDDGEPGVGEEALAVHVARLGPYDSIDAPAGIFEGTTEQTPAAGVASGSVFTTLVLPERGCLRCRHAGDLSELGLGVVENITIAGAGIVYWGCLDGSACTARQVARRASGSSNASTLGICEACSVEPASDNTPGPAAGR